MKALEKYEAGQKMKLRSPELEDIVSVIEATEYWEKAVLVYSPKRRCNILVWTHYLERIKMIFPKCVGCGYCCISVPCYLSVYNEWGDIYKRCEKLYWDGERYRCKEIESNSTLASNVGAGAGCPSTLGNTWRQDVKRR